MGLEEAKLVEQFIRQEAQDSTINKSDNLVQKSTNIPKYPTLTTLNEIIMGDNNPSNDQVGCNTCKQPNPDAQLPIY